MTYDSWQIWVIILGLGAGTFLIRLSFLGLIGDRPMPPFVLRLLRYTAVAVIPGMVAPLVIWPAATGGEADPARLTAAIVALAVGIWTRHTLWAILSGAITLFGMIALS